MSIRQSLRYPSIKFPRNLQRCVSIHIPKRFQSSSSSDDGPSPSISSALSPFIDHLHLLDENTKLRLANRHVGIHVHPLSIAHKMVPYNQILKTNSKTGTTRLVDVERSSGYFWTLNDLKITENKPILSNEHIIHVKDAKVFPALGLTSGIVKRIDIEGENSKESIHLPHFLTQKNRSMDPGTQCTLLTVSYNDYGYQMLPLWIDRFREAFTNNRDSSFRADVYKLIVHEGRVLSFLESFITRSYRRKIPMQEKSSVLLYFTKGGEDNEEYLSFRDCLRMHNDKTAYVYLLDGLGRVRFAGSGRPSAKDIEHLISFTKTLVPALKSSGSTKART